MNTGIAFTAEELEELAVAFDMQASDWLRIQEGLDPAEESERAVAGQRLREAIIVRHALSKLAATSDKFWLPHAW